MNVLNTAAILASEGAEGSGGAVVPGWAFGIFAFVVLSVLLIATMMIKVDRD